MVSAFLEAFNLTPEQAAYIEVARTVWLEAGGFDDPYLEPYLLRFCIGGKWDGNKVRKQNPFPALSTTGAPTIVSHPILFHPFPSHLAAPHRPHPTPTPPHPTHPTPSHSIPSHVNSPRPTPTRQVTKHLKKTAEWRLNVGANAFRADAHSGMKMAEKPIAVKALSLMPFLPCMGFSKSGDLLDFM